MNLRTELVVRPAAWSLGLSDPVLTLGSCFAQSIGQRFVVHKFQALVNPFGTTYHPLAIHKLLAYATFQEYPAAHTYLENQGTVFNYDFHSSLSALRLTDLQLQLQERISTVHYLLKNCTLLIITYGTAWLYERTDTGEPVANCHRMRTSFFSKRLAPIEEITGSFRQMITALSTINPNLKIMLTVSPVRHINDTLPLNSLSKSTLRVACHQISQEYGQPEYFPAYEMMIDDLRDYRFYKNDLIHPTDMAEDFIWEKFADTYFTKDTRNFLKQWESIQHSIHHKPFQPEGESYQQFLLKTLIQLNDLKSVVNVEQEISEIKSRLIDRSS